MAEEKERALGLGAIWKAITTSVVGLVSGAVLMYVSPLVNNAIKPPRPVPNFGFQAEGATVTFNNRSTGGVQGWWDFGDGSPREPFSAQQATMIHRFPGPGSYNVRLALNNLIGEEAEWAVPVKIDATAQPPVIESLQAVPVTPVGANGSPAAPATFRLVAKIKNADLALWSIDEQPLELVTEFGAGTIEHYATFAYYGPKKARLLAVSGKQRAEREVDLWVDVPDNDPQIVIMPMVTQTKSEIVPFSVSLPPTHQGATFPFEIVRSVAADQMIVEAQIDQRPSDRLVRNPQLLISPDKKSFSIRGELLRTTGRNAVPPSWFGKVEMKVSSRNATPSARSAPVAGKLQLPGRTVVATPPPPPSAAGAAVGIQWEIRQGMDVLMRDTKTPAAQVARLGGRDYRVVVQQVGGQIQIDAALAQPTAGAPTPPPAFVPTSRKQ